MSLIIAAWTSEGIVMGSDSRISFSSQINPQIPINIQTGHFFDTQEKTFLCPNNCGISTCGAASMNGTNISGFIHEFINNKIKPSTTVEETASNLAKFISSLDSNAEIHFFVAGYDSSQEPAIPTVIKVITGQNSSLQKISNATGGATWDGEIETITRIIKPHYLCQGPIRSNVKIDNGETDLGDCLIFPLKQTTIYEENTIPWEYMTIQDAIDFVRYAINTTIDTMRFANVSKTVGGPIDILTISPIKAKWIAHKKLH